MSGGGRQRNPLSRTGRLLQRTVRLCCARPALTLVLGVVFAALGGAYAWHALTLDTSKFHLLPTHQRYATLYKSYSEDFGQLEDIVVVIESPDGAVSKAYAARLARVLREGGAAPPPGRACPATARARPRTSTIAAPSRTARGGTSCPCRSRRCGISSRPS